MMSAKQLKGLGKGFDVLISKDIEETVLNQNKERVQKLFINDIKPNPDQPRKNFEQYALEELAESIKAHGVLQPLLVSPTEEGKYIIIAGERRWRASRLAGLDKVPVIVRTAELMEQLELALVENIQRVDLSPLEQAASVQRLHEMFGFSFDDIAKRLHKAPSTVNNIVRLLQLPDSAKSALSENKITEGHARAILSLKDQQDQQEQLLNLIIKNGWSVRQAEQFAVAAKSGMKNVKKAQQRTRETSPATKNLSNLLKRPVTVKHMAKGGRLIIRFKTDEDLNGLIELLETVKTDKN